MNIFISYNRQNSSFVSSVTQQLKSHISIVKEVFLDQDNLIGGQVWTDEIQQALQQSDACIVFIGEQGIGGWQNKEVLVAINKYMDSKGEFKIIPLIIPHSKRDQVQKNFPWFLADIQWIEFANESDPEAFQKLLVCLTGNEAPAFQITRDMIPYKGLDFFDVADAPFFFGRTFDVNWIFYKKLQLQSKTGNRFLAVVGDSGSGKSSFARAGILATLKAGRFAGSPSWKQLIFSPEDNPLLKLSAALQAAGIIADAKKMEDDAKADSTSLRRVVEIYGRKMVVMIDQFEELLTQCKDNIQREAFLNNITEALKSQYFICIITLRSDFYAAFSPFREFADLMENTNYTITSLDYNTGGEEWIRYMRAIIQKPALLLGVRFQPVLINQIIEDCKAINGILPALQLALVALWKKGKDKGEIESSDYDSLANHKGIAGIIEAHANSTWDILTKDESDKEACSMIKAIFIRLVEITGNKEDVRKTVSKAALTSELLSQYKQEAIDNMLVALSGPEARLIRIKQDSVAENRYWVEVIHEVLIRQWEKLREWLNERREAIRYKNKLEQNIDDGDNLLTGKKLTDAEQWINHNKDLATDKIINVIKESRAKVNKRKLAIGIGLAVTILLTISAWLYYPVYQCRACALVNTWEAGNYDVNEVHSITLNGTTDIKYLRCFKNLDSLILLAKDEENYLSQAIIDELPDRLQQLSIERFISSDTLLSFKTFSKLKVLTIYTTSGLRKIRASKMPELTTINLKILNDFNSLSGIEDLKNLTTLNLSYLGQLSTLEGIENFKSLQTLRLINMPGLAGIEKLNNLQSLELIDVPMQDLKGFKNFRNLQSLEIALVPSLTILDGIEQMPNLKTLGLRSMLNLTHLTGIENLENLQSLTLLSLRKLSSLDGIEHLKSLQTLRLENIDITSVSGIQNLKRLLSLDFAKLRNVTSLAGIEQLANLQSITFSYLKLTGLTEVKHLNRLENISIDNLPFIKDLADLEQLNSLQTLSLSNMQDLNSLAGLESLSALSTLDLANNLNLHSLSGIDHLKKLQSLSLSYLPGVNLDSIGNLEKLKFLTLSQFSIPDLATIKNLKTLETLNLSDLKMQSLAGIEDLKNLRSVNLSYLAQTNLSGIEQLKNIRSLYLSNIGQSNFDLVIIPAFTSENSIDTLVMSSINLPNLNFLDRKPKVKIFIYDKVALSNKEREFSKKAKEMKQTKFYNKTILGSPNDN